jgi:hypothetical protein
MGSELIEDAIVAIAAEVDSESTRGTARRQQQQLEFPGFDLEDEYALDGGRRIAKRYAQLQHAETWLRIDDENLDNVTKANARKHKEIDDLRPFWGPGITKREAVEAFSNASPGAA